MKRYTAKKAGRICEKVLSAARSVGGEKNIPLCNAWTDAAGRTYVCDGYRAYRLNAAPEGMTVTWSVHIWSDAIRARVNQVRDGVQRMFKLPDTGDADGYTLSEMPAPGRMVSPVYAVSDNGTAVILPIRDERKFHWGR